jgi:hypothetical protein
MTDEREAQRAEIKAAWSEAGDRLSGLGAKLKQHYAEHQGGTEPEQAGSEVKEAVKRLGVAVQDAFEAIGTAAQDEAVKKDVKDVGQSVASALGATFTVIGDEVRKAFDTPKGAVQDRSPEHADGDGPTPGHAQGPGTGQAPYAAPEPTEGGSAGGRTAPAPEPDRPPVQDAPTIVDPPITMEEPPPASPEADR